MPYSNLPDSAFWSRCRSAPDFLMKDLFTPKFALEPGMRIASAGSCFAQNIARYIKASALAFVDVEPKPRLMPDEIAGQHGYGLFSARYGNIYTARQLRQLLDDISSETFRDCAVWTKGDRFYDALRPNVEPTGFDNKLELVAHRLDHLRRVRQLFDGLDVFVFTLGLTETWVHRETGTVFPIAPGVIAGVYDPDIHRFHNTRFAETRDDLVAAIAAMRGMAPNLKILLSVSPVPLTATASNHHVLRATTYSKSVLRAVAEDVAADDPAVDYFPAYEIVTGSPYKSSFYNDNLRSVTSLGVDAVMSTFFAAYPSLPSLDDPRLHQDRPVPSPVEDVEDAICEEAMLDAFAK